ncbi:N-acetyltransferase [Microbacterium sp. 2C]|uniref:GNAT family N-acetyltransferase n=1 Tax=Microbacterium paulum TaxID=2707006 RepID=UPI0018C2A1DB|nr:GNAT family N-acetyltransferase [Microbacterium paulum]MBG0718781.1 N-acetyltransferase [Microbacterium paulum]
MSDDVKVVRSDEKERYEITVDGGVAGFAEFVLASPGRVIYPHTEIDPAYGGRGLGSTLVGEAMADEARRGDTVIPVCPFVIKYLKTHEVPGLNIEWRPRDVEVAEHAPTDEKHPGDEGVGDWRG